jgi:hypothetical protein
MATTEEIRERIEQRLAQLLIDADRLQRALDALGPRSARSRRDTSSPPAAPARANPKPPRPAAAHNELAARATRLPPDRAHDRPDAAQRALRALRAELGAGLRTTGGA